MNDEILPPPGEPAPPPADEPVALDYDANKLLEGRSALIQLMVLGGLLALRLNALDKTWLPAAIVFVALPALGVLFLRRCRRTSYSIQQDVLSVERDGRRDIIPLASIRRVDFGFWAIRVFADSPRPALAVVLVPTVAENDGLAALLLEVQRARLWKEGLAEVRLSPSDAGPSTAERLAPIGAAVLILAALALLSAETFAFENRLREYRDLPTPRRDEGWAASWDRGFPAWDWLAAGRLAYCAALFAGCAAAGTLLCWRRRRLRACCAGLAALRVTPAGLELDRSDGLRRVSCEEIASVEAGPFFLHVRTADRGSFVIPAGGAFRLLWPAFAGKFRRSLSQILFLPMALAYAFFAAAAAFLFVFYAAV